MWYFKDKRQSQDNQDKEVQLKVQRTKNRAGDMDVCPLWVLSGRGLCDGLITHPEESYRLWCVLVCDLGTTRMRRLELVRVENAG
jgi:hypothetical protein